MTQPPKRPVYTPPPHEEPTIRDVLEALREVESTVKSLDNGVKQLLEKLTEIQGLVEELRED